MKSKIFLPLLNSKILENLIMLCHLTVNLFVIQKCPLILSLKGLALSARNSEFVEV